MNYSTSYCICHGEKEKQAIEGTRLRKSKDVNGANIVGEFYHFPHLFLHPRLLFAKPAIKRAGTLFSSQRRRKMCPKKTFLFSAFVDSLLAPTLPPSLFEIKAYNVSFAVPNTHLLKQVGLMPCQRVNTQDVGSIDQ